MKKLTALFVASTLALGAANLAHAADATATPTDNAPMMHHKRGPAGPHEMMFKGLNLTDAQKTAVENVVRELLLKKEPELIVKAAQEMQSRMEKEQASKSVASITENKSKIYRTILRIFWVTIKQ